MKKPIILTVLVTLGVVAAFAATFVMGMKYEQNKNDMVKSEAAAIVKNVKVDVQPSKQ